MKDSSITFKLSEKEKEKIVLAATKRDVPISQLIREALKKYLEGEKE